MRTIDAVTHFFPKRLFDRMMAAPGFVGDIGKRMRGVPSVWDIDVRMKVVERFADYRQILSLGLPPSTSSPGPKRRPNMRGSAMTGWPSCARAIPTASPGIWRRCP